MTGAGYTDVNAVIPGRQILAAIAVGVAILFFITALIGRWRLPLVGTALLIVSSLIIGALYPWIIQRFQVDPSARSLEAPYIERSIDLTRGGLRRRRHRDDPVRGQDGRRARRAPRGRRDHGEHPPDGPARDQPRVPAARAVPPVLPVPRRARRRPLRDRRLDAGHRGRGARPAAGRPRRRRDLVQLAHRLHARLRPRGGGGQPALGRRAARVPPVRASRRRVRSASSSPASTSARTRRPTRSSAAPEGADPVELDYPAGGESEQQTQTTFEGDGGPKLDNVFTKLVYALKFQSEQIFLSDAVNDRLADPLRPRPDRAREEGRPLPHARLRHLPVGRRRAHRVDRRRLHAHRPVPVLEQGRA